MRLSSVLTSTARAQSLVPPAPAAIWSVADRRKWGLSVRVEGEEGKKGKGRWWRMDSRHAAAAQHPDSQPRKG